MKEIIGFSRYKIAIDGNVFDTKKNRFLRISQFKSDGYKFVSLVKDLNLGRKTMYIHRLIGLSYIENAENKPFINHINGIKNDNRIENLEWCTNKENINKAWAMGLCENVRNNFKSESTIKPCIVNGVRYGSVNEAALHCGFCQSYLSKVLNKRFFSKKIVATFI